ncbi:MAG: PD-(D/E)XK nuclease family protein [Pseudomonadota bacterium]
MLLPTLKIAPGPSFWAEVAQALLKVLPSLSRATSASATPSDLSGLRMVVPTLGHTLQLRQALHDALGGAFIAPRICTMSGWLDLQRSQDHSVGVPSDKIVSTGNERLMQLYAELRQHAWLKKLFTARRNTDLLPLAQTLLALADELTAALLPGMAQHAEHAEARWEAALSQLPPSARSVLSEEAQLVWAIWKSLLTAEDPGAVAFEKMMRLAADATSPLVWIAPTASDACAHAFLEAWAEQQPVLIVHLDWCAEKLPWAMGKAWPELLEPCETSLEFSRSSFGTGAALPWIERPLRHVALSPACSLEEEASRGAQTIVDWLEEGKAAIAIVVQDRVVARRLRALLQRAQVQVADETGWKLSTTRAAAALTAWFDVVTTRAQNTALLDFLKSPFLLEASEKNADSVMVIEIALRRGNVAGGWGAIMAAVPAGPARERVQHLSNQADMFKKRHTIAAWMNLTIATLDALGMAEAYRKDAAGQQLITLLSQIARDCSPLLQEFSFSEWRAFASMQMESTTFVPPVSDKRVVMLPLHCAHLRAFDAVLVVGADAAHLPAVPNETLFFANPVRRELGLVTREQRQLEQLRNFAELLTANPLVVVSWQSVRDGESNPVSSWVERLDLALAIQELPGLRVHQTCLPQVALAYERSFMPAVVAPDLLPKKLSASGYTALVDCPYQFFATRMLGLAGLDEFSERPEKRDYGDWLHQILHLFHAGLRDKVAGAEDPAAFLELLTQQVFAAELARSGAALGYYDRWAKAMPAYLEWATTREATGWTFLEGEQWREQILRWPGGEVLLHGRIDRLDCNAAGETAVIDYKTKDAASLKKRIEGNEDHQLAFYGLLSESPPASAHFVGLEPHKEKIGTVDATDYAVWQEQLRQQIGTTLQAIAEGAALRASGIESICQYCDVRGLCRKGAW